MRCPNCGKSEFEQMPLYEIYCTEGGADQLVIGQAPATVPNCCLGNQYD